MDLMVWLNFQYEQPPALVDPIAIVSSLSRAPPKKKKSAKFSKIVFELLIAHSFTLKNWNAYFSQRISKKILRIYKNIRGQCMCYCFCKRVDSDGDSKQLSDATEYSMDQFIDAIGNTTANLHAT